MGTILREDDFEIGMLLTGHSYVWEEEDDGYCEDEMPMFMSFSTAQGPPEDPTKKYNGKIYHLKGINLPYIAIDPVNPAEAFQGGMAVCAGAGMANDVVFSALGTTTCVVDIRRYKFTKITPEFAKAVLGDQII